MDDALAAPPPAGRLRWLLLVLCLALLALLVGSGLVAVRLFGEMHAQELAVSRVLAERTEMLSGLWTAIQNYNQAVQQFVTRTKATEVELARQRLDRLTLEIDGQLRGYPTGHDPVESALLAGMQDVFEQQRTIYLTVLAARPGLPRRQAEALISNRMLPLQNQIVEWSAKLRSWNGDRLRQADQTLLGEFGRAQGRLSQTLAISFGSGFLLMLGGVAYIFRLERQTRDRYVQLARSQHELQQLSSRLLDAQETERRSISRELHDEVGQSLGALLVDIGRLASAVPQERPDDKAQLEHMKSVAERTVQAVRNMALLLRPSMLDDLGLVAALEWQGREISRRSEMEVAVESGNLSDDLPDDFKTCIYRLVQEALHNAVRHSGARNAQVQVEQRGRSVCVRVTDDGRGFDPERSRGLGILGMEERVKRLGGTFSIKSTAGHGTTVTAELPLETR
jgi:signal transduction histidine kinase